MPHFHLTTTWEIPASIETCWFCILDVKTWPSWWQYVDTVIELEPGDASGINNIHQYNWSTCLPYHLVFNLRVTKLDPFRQITFAAMGDLKGHGYCKFTEKNSFTHIQFDWNVETNKAWMSIVAAIAHPIFKWNHKRVMQSGEQSLIRRLNSSS